MNGTLEETSSSSLAVVEKKLHRPGGCVGIFFQLFDWNRRFAKKKLFSKKLLPPVRLTQSSKKYAGDEKQPKLRLIADVNNGGFPITKNNSWANNVDIRQHQEMRVPGLVARLMGLESMPALHRDKSKKVPASSNHVPGKADKYVDYESNVEKGGGIKHELRPQKLQKTSASERQPITRSGPEKLPPFKSNVSKKSRKHHHPKLPPPVKSPRNASRKNSSKLIGAATRILEPSSRLKCALTYTNTSHRHPTQNTIVEDSSCRNCGYRPDNLHNKTVVSEKPLIFAQPFADCVGSSCRESEGSKAENSVFYQDELRDGYDGDIQSHVKFTSYTSRFSGETQRKSSSHPKAPPLSLSLNDKAQTQIKMFPPRPKSNNEDGSKNFVSVNQSLSSSSRPCLPARMENGKFELEKKVSSNSLNNSVPPGRKRRPANVSRQGETAGFLTSTDNKRNFGSGIQLGYKSHFINSRNELSDLQERTAEHRRIQNNVVSFMFDSPVKYKSGIQEVMERSTRNDLRFDDSLPKLAFGENGGSAKSEKPFPLGGDALGALLQQKLKELNYEGDDIKSNGARKTTSMVLQELICALTSDKLFQQVYLPALSDKRNSSQANAMAAKLPIEQPLDSERPSPGSVLEAYLSTESCHSSSLAESLGCKMLNESIGCSYSAPPSPNPNSEFLGSAALISNRAKSSNELVINILKHVSAILSCNIFANCGVKGNKLDQAKEALLNAELILHSAVISGAVVGKGCCPIKCLLLHELETLTSVLCMNFGNSLGFEDGQDANQIIFFVLDAIIEYLDERFGKYLEAGSEVARKFPLGMNTNTLIFEIVDVVGKWDELSRYNNLDELIEREMGFSLREWTEFETEGFESGLEISRNVLQTLVDEIVTDLWKYAA